LLPRVAASAGAGRTTGTRPARPRPPHTTLCREGGREARTTHRRHVCSAATTAREYLLYVVGFAAPF
jgi:hypothetical protein